jgi:hypothetical protein
VWTILHSCFELFLASKYFTQLAQDLGKRVVFLSLATLIHAFFCFLASRQVVTIRDIFSKVKNGDVLVDTADTTLSFWVSEGKVDPDALANKLESLLVQWQVDDKVKLWQEAGKHLRSYNTI